MLTTLLPLWALLIYLFFGIIVASTFLRYDTADEFSKDWQLAVTFTWPLAVMLFVAFYVGSSILSVIKFLSGKG